jgi:hypothetical protein
MSQMATLKWKCGAQGSTGSARLRLRCRLPLYPLPAADARGGCCGSRTCGLARSTSRQALLLLILRGSGRGQRADCEGEGEWAWAWDENRRGVYDRRKRMTVERG